MSILLAATALALLALAASVVWAGRVVLRTYERPAPAVHSTATVEKLAWIEGVLEGHDQRFEALTIAVSEGVAGYKRHEKRVQKTVTSARRLVANAGLEHAGLDAEVEELHEGNEADSEPEPVQAVQSSLEFDGPSGIPGISRSELKEMRGA